VLALLAAAGCTKNTDIRTFPTARGAVGDLQQGAVDAVVGDYPVIAFEARESAGKLQVAGRQYDIATLGMGVAKDAPQLKAAITDALRRIVADKTYHAIMVTWAVTEAEVDAPAAPAGVPAPGDVPQLKDGVLKVGMELSYAPMEFYDETKREAGVDVELGQALGKALGVKVEFVDMPFDALLGAVETGKVDVVASAMAITPEREQRVDFIPYMALGSGILVEKGNPNRIRTVTDLCHRVVGVQAGTSQLSNLQSLKCE
ncbi:MAG: transporter substrate-binding domain-containing protein, partial [Deltaproteobacteria bacterium]|nr:transporter substrate-binding domain-containing protein [Deltaproteobacteria bacterium]